MECADARDFLGVDDFLIAQNGGTTMRNRSHRGSVVRRTTIRGRANRYSTEIAIAAVGALVGLAEATLADDTDTALLVVVASFLLALAVAAIRQDIATEIAANSHEIQLLAAIPDERWRHEAASALDRQRAEFTAWAAGTRTVDETHSLRYQIEVVRSSEQSIDAVHLALDDHSIDMWVNPQGRFDRLADAYRELPDKIRKRRILVLDESAADARLGGRRMITDPRVRKICEDQTRPRSEGGLGFELRVRWVTPSPQTRLADTLIVDEREVCSIEGHGDGRFGDLTVAVNAAVVQANVHAFEDLWTSSMLLTACLDAETPSDDGGDQIGR